MNDILLNFEKVSFKLGKKIILSDLNVSLKAGNSLAIIGHNGAGKTTLFHLALGLKVATDGSVRLFGLPAFEPAARTKLGYVAERPYLNDQLTLIQTLQYFGKLAGLSASLLLSRINAVIEQVGLMHAKEQKLKTFSKGMLQRTLIAQALIASPELLILDEPMSGLDPEGREFVSALMLDLKKQGKSMVFSTHTLEDVDMLADEVLVLEKGVTEFKGSVKEWRART